VWAVLAARDRQGPYLLSSNPKSVAFAESSALPAPAFHDPKHHLTIYQADCLKILPALPAESVDLIFADPPYFLSNGGITCHAGRMVSVNKGSWDRSLGPEANHEFNRAWLKACQRVLKPNGTIWVSGTSHVIHSVGFAMQQLGFKLLNDISWVKPNPPPNLSCRYFTHATETIIWAAKDLKSKHKFHYQAMRQEAKGKQMKSVWEQIRPPEPEEKRFGKHPTQKPLALLDRILRASSDPGDLVLDPFAGSGTTVLAAIRLRRSAIGCELSGESLSLSLRRICSDLVQVEVSFSCYQFSLDLFSDPVDRSNRAESAAMSAFAGKLVRTERTFYFIGAAHREIVFSVMAADLDHAWRDFNSSKNSGTQILFVIKNETEIYLA
jgi:site-specific DNA-methyltransferase (adenine-specific)